MKIFKNLELGKLSKQQLIAISEISRDSAQVILGGLVINQIFAGIDDIDWSSFIIGMIIVIGLWFLSVLILKK